MRDGGGRGAPSFPSRLLCSLVFLSFLIPQGLSVQPGFSCHSPFRKVLSITWQLAPQRQRQVALLGRGRPRPAQWDCFHVGLFLRVHRGRLAGGTPALNTGLPKSCPRRVRGRRAIFWSTHLGEKIAALGLETEDGQVFNIFCELYLAKLFSNLTK